MMAGEQKRRFSEAEPQLAYDLARNKHAVQMSQIEALDAKISNILGLASALIGILAAFLALHEKRPPDTSIAALVVAGTAQGLLAILSLLGYFPRQWSVGPKLEEAWDDSAKWDPREMYWWAAEAFKDQSKDNASRLGLKVFAARASFLLLIGEALALATGLMLAAAD